MRSLSAYLVVAFGSLFLYFSVHETDQRPDQRPDRLVENLGPSINSKFAEMFPFVSRNGLALYFSSDRPVGAGNSIEGARSPWDLYVALRNSVDDPFQAAVNLGPTVNSPFRDYAVGFSKDALWLYIASDRLKAGGSDTELFVSYRESISDHLAWGAPQHLICTIETESGETCPIFAASGNSGEERLYFVGAVVQEALDFEVDDAEPGERDLDRMNLLPVARLGNVRPALMSPEREAEREDVLPTRTIDGQVFFPSNRSGGYGDFDLYRVAGKSP